MNISVQCGNILEIASDVLVVGLFEGNKLLEGIVKELDDKLEGLISKEILEQDNFSAKLGKTSVTSTLSKIPARKLLVVGLGKQEKLDFNTIRKVAAEAIKACKRLNSEKVTFLFCPSGYSNSETKLSAQALTEGALLSTYSFDKYKKSNENDNDKKEFQDLVIVEPNGERYDDINYGIFCGRVIAESTNFSRDLVNEAPSVMTPSKLAEMAQSIGLECKIYEQSEIEAMGMGSFLAVARGSVEPPKFIHMTYRPEGTPVKKIAIVGKGITFDSGGLDLKTAAGMLTMKMDMSGSAAVLGIMKAIKELKPNVEVLGIVPTCENMPDGKSYKPGDVLISKSGKTIEVNNTDAEGRLILADALTYAVEQNPDEIFDLATLTGAVVVALGSCCAGIMGNNQELIDRFINLSGKSGEKHWQLPLFEEYKEFLKSDVADIVNSGSREAGSSFGGVFLQEFVKDVPWIHLDIAGAAWLDKPKYELPKGSTAFGVRSLVYYLMQY